MTGFPFFFGGLCEMLCEQEHNDKMQPLKMNIPIRVRATASRAGLWVLILALIWRSLIRLLERLRLRWVLLIVTRLWIAILSWLVRSGASRGAVPSHGFGRRSHEMLVLGGEMTLLAFRQHAEDPNQGFWLKGEVKKKDECIRG